jgi:hypothetical protein
VRPGEALLLPQNWGSFLCTAVMVVTMMLAVMPDAGKRRSSYQHKEQHSSNFLHTRNLA